MTYEAIYKKACDVIGAENIDDYRPAVFEAKPDTMLDGLERCVQNTIMIWLKNGDLIWYRAEVKQNYALYRLIITASK